MKPESVAKGPPKLSNKVRRRFMLDYLQNMRSKIRFGEVTDGGGGRLEQRRVRVK